MCTAVDKKLNLVTVISTILVCPLVVTILGMLELYALVSTVSVHIKCTNLLYDMASNR